MLHNLPSAFKKTLGTNQVVILREVGEAGLGVWLRALHAHEARVAAKGPSKYIVQGSERKTVQVKTQPEDRKEVRKFRSQSPLGSRVKEDVLGFFRETEPKSKRYAVTPET